MALDSKYIHHKIINQFKGNQFFTLNTNQYCVREDDTTTVYEKNSIQSMSEVKRILKRFAGEKGGQVTLSGAYPRYYLQVSC